MKISLLISLWVLSVASLSYAAVPNPGDFSVYAIQNIGQSASNPYGNTDFAGIAAAGGNVYLQNFGLNSIGGSTGPISLFVGQDFSLNSGQINNGGIEVAGNIAITNTSIYGDVSGGGNLGGTGGMVQGNVNLAGQNTSTATISGTVNQNTGTFTPTLNLPQTSAYFQNASAAYKSLMQSPWVNSSISFGMLNLTGLQAGLNIVNLSLATANTLSSIFFSGNPSAIVVFNITGNGGTASQTLNALTINGLGLSNILFNITSAQFLSLSGGAYASVLAPGSNVTFTSGNLVGSLIANNLYGNGEVERGLFSGWSTVPSQFPEPSTYLLLATFLGFLVIRSARKRYQKCKAEEHNTLAEPH